MDIDGYAGCVAYAELLRALGFEARAVSTATFNNSVTPAARSWPVQFDTSYRPADEDRFTIIDVSSPADLDRLVSLDKVEAVIDHHPGFEEYWRRLGGRAVIEPVGAACTLVYEAWEKSALFGALSPEAAKLMACGILDNTLNFQAEIVGDRDRNAYRRLAEVATLPADWPASYFVDCENGLRAGFREALTNDTKILKLKALDGESLAVGQLVVWAGRDAVSRFAGRVRRIMPAFRPRWFVNFISLEEGRCHLLASDLDLAGRLADLLGGAEVSADRTAVTDRLWLRKEILRRDIEATGKAGS